MHFNCWIWIVTADIKIFELEIINRLDYTFEMQRGEWFGLAHQLFLEWFHVV